MEYMRDAMAKKESERKKERVRERDGNDGGELQEREMKRDLYTTIMNIYAMCRKRDLLVFLYRVHEELTCSLS